MKFGIRTIWQLFARSLQWLFVLGTVCVLALPFPTVAVPESASDKDLTESFPCMHRECGCRSAEQCWKSCCCFSNREKVAWARANKVSVPLLVHQAAHKELSSSIAQSRTKGSCCDRVQNSTSSLAASESSSPTPASNTSTSKSKSTRDNSTHWITLKEVAECQGNAVFWLTISAFALPNPVVMQFAGPLPPEIIESPPASLVCVFRTPPSPPPDSCAHGSLV
jgi:hypothetical protein